MSSYFVHKKLTAPFSLLSAIPPLLLPHMRKEKKKLQEAITVSRVFYLQRKHGDSLWSIDVVPNAETVPVLSNHHITAWHPLHVGAVVQDGGLGAAVNVIELQLQVGEENRAQLDLWLGCSHKCGRNI